MKKLLVLFLLGFSTLLVFPHRISAQSVKVGITSKAIFYLPFFVAQKRGFYAGEGLKVEIILIGSSSVQLQALVASDLHFGSFNPDGVILFNEKGGNLRLIAGVDNTAPYVLIGGKNYKKIEELRGAKLGVSSLRGGATSILLDYLRSKGLLYPRDFTLVVISGGTPARLSALEGGAVAGAVLGVPYSDIAIDQGFNKLGDTVEAIPAYQFNSVNVNPVWAEKNRATVVKFLKAHIRSLRWIHENLDEAAGFFSQEMGVKPPYARKGVEYYTKNKIFPVDGSVTLDGLKVNLQVQAKDGLLREPLSPPERYVDLSYLRQAQRELGM